MSGGILCFNADCCIAYSLNWAGRVEVLGPQVPSGLSWMGGSTKSGMM